VAAARAADGTFLFVYLPRGGNLTVDMTKISGKEAIAHWFNPRDGRATRIGTLDCTSEREFASPSRGLDNDWVLVLDEATQKFPMPAAQQSQSGNRP
jgi:hypothetical protein